MSDNIIEITETSNYSITIDTNLVQNDNGVTIETSSPYSIEIIDNNIVLLNDLPQGYPLNWTSGNLPIARVSGLDIVGGSGISVSDNSGIYTIAVTGTFGLTGEEVDDRVGDLLTAGNYVNLNYNDSLNSLSINVTGVQPSGNYSVVGHSHAISDVSGLQNVLDSKQPSGVYASGIHNHTSSDIINFSSSVSGLLPVKNITSGSGISVSNNNGVFSVAVTGTFGLTSEQVDDRVNNLLSAGSYVALNYNDSLDSLTISVTGLQPSGNYSVNGHSHVIADVSGLENALDNKQPSGSYAQLIHNHLSSDITDFNSSVSGLLPNTYDAAVPWTPNHTLVDGTRYLAGDLVYESGRLYKANYDNESLPVSNTTYWADVGPGYRLNIDGRDIPNIQYPVTSVNGYSGIIELSTTDLNDFNSSVSGLLAPYALLDSPAFSGTPTVPTAPSGTNDNQIANTSFVRSEISNLVNSAPNTLDTLNELANALGNDPNFATTIASGLSQKSNIGHTHTASEITNFNSGVSGLLPAVTGSGYVTSSFSNNIYTISVSGLQPSGNYANSVHTHSYADITDFSSGIDNEVSTLLVAGSYINLNYDNTTDILTISATGVQPSGSYANSVHSHGNISSSGTIGSSSGLLVTTTTNGALTTSSGISSSYITNFNSSVSGLLPSVTGSGYVNSSFNNNTYTISVNGLQPSGNYSIVGHSHLSSEITDFNSSVSGLIPVKDILAGSGISISGISGIYTVTSIVDEVSRAASIVTTVFNKTANTINKGSVVYINGGQGDQPTIQLAIANGETGSSKTYGITSENITSMNTGRVVVLGALTGFNTDQFNPTAPHGDVNGTTLYLSPSVSGLMTTTKPSAPDHMVSVGTIVRTHQNEGVIEVRIQNGFELEELHNVAISGVTSGQFLQYNGSGLWVPSSSGNFSTLLVNGTGVSLNGHTHTSSNITDFSSSVSGLLPVTDIIGGTNISVTPSGSVYSISVSGSLGLTTEEVDDRVSNLLVAGTGISLDYNDGSNTLTINTSGLQPSGNYSLTGHTHSSSDISDFNTSVSGLLPVTNITAGSGIAVSSTSGNFTINAVQNIINGSNLYLWANFR